jgi:hypothetical protein
MSDYMPDSDGDFSSWLSQFVDYANLHKDDWNLDPGETTPLAALRSEFEDARNQNDNLQAQARAARSTKDAARAHSEEFIRPLVARLQTNASVTDAQRLALGITVRSTSRSPTAAPSTKPVATVDTTQRLQHTIAFVDELTPTSRAKPDGAMGCEIWVKVDGPPPADPSELQYLATDTRSPYLAEFDGAKAGKIAYYMLRWVSTRGEKGPWSQTVSATITA